MFRRRRVSPIFLLGVAGCALIAAATGLYFVSTQFWSGGKVADLDALDGPVSVTLDPAMNPVRVIVHRSGPRLRKSVRASVDVTLRDAAGAELWTKSVRWSGRSAKSRGSGRSKSASVLATFDVPAPGEYRLEAAVHAPEGYEPRALRFEVRRQVARVNPAIVWTGVAVAALSLLVGALGARLVRA